MELWQYPSRYSSEKSSIQFSTSKRACRLIPIVEYYLHLISLLEQRLIYYLLVTFRFEEAWCFLSTVKQNTKRAFIDHTFSLWKSTKFFSSSLSLLSQSLLTDILKFLWFVQNRRGHLKQLEMRLSEISTLVMRNIEGCDRFLLPSVPTSRHFSRKRCYSGKHFAVRYLSLKLLPATPV